MNRILRATSSGLFAASLAVLPLSAFAQGGTAADAKTPAKTPATTQTTAPQTTAPQAKAGTTAAAPAAKTDGAKTSATMPAPSTAKTGG